ncbi:MAG: flagellar motor switch phosphatase FliY [Anaerofustis sp.]
MDANQPNQLTPMEIDAIGEIMNISLGSSVTSISTMLDKRVNITTPLVRVTTVDEFGFESYEPAVGVEINYIEGLTGSNVMILKESDIKVIVGLLLGIDFSQEEFVMDEMNTSAVCEVMNQMMGASATALTQFLGFSVNISTPTSFPIEDTSIFKDKYFKGYGTIVTISFHLIVEDLINSEFISVVNIDFARELVNRFLQGSASHEEAPRASQPTVSPDPQPQPAVQESAPSEPKASSSQPKAVPREKQDMTSHQVSKPNLDNFADESQALLSPGQSNNLNLILNVPLQITVEIGRSKRKIKEILEMTPGTIIELNKQAGSQVDIFVNNKVVARGDVVIVDDYYGVRVTDVLSDEEMMNIL